MFQTITNGLLKQRMRRYYFTKTISLILIFINFRMRIFINFLTVDMGLLKLDGILKINSKINVNQTNKKFYYIVNGVDKNSNQVYEENNIDIPIGKYDLNELYK
uniref:Uncharacterized protein n=1 Tax=Heterorhabditis bacteriophora TaxID=37862 RepID=A0A1I7WKI6_HETBA